MSIEVIKKDVSIKEVTKCMTLDKTKWQIRIHVTNPEQAIKDL